jgi:multiple sugar transport system ATP-binding protein
MGRAIVRDPQVFLFDDPLSNLEAKPCAQMSTEIKALHQRLKTTSVYVTHDQIEATALADKGRGDKPLQRGEIGSPPI